METIKTIRKPPIAMANILKDTKNLFLPLIDKTHPKAAHIHFSFQTNGYPHLGTITSVMIAFRIGEMLHKLDISPQIEIEVLENAPAITKKINKKSYSLSFSDYFENEILIMDRYMDSFMQLFEFLSEWSKVKYYLLYYDKFQSDPQVRKKLIFILKNYIDFSNIFSPSDGIIRIRTKCPMCNYLNKDSTTVRIEKSNEALVISSECYEHGRHSIILAENNDDFIDMNTALRNVIKESVFIENAKKEKALNIMVDGVDWVYIIPLIEQGLGLFNHSIKQLPIRVFAPLIIDETGAKFSKSIHMKSDVYSEISNQIIKNMGRDISSYKNILTALWEETGRWIKNPQLLFRNYSVSYFEQLFGGIR